jgi:hypothetical protein
MFEKTKPILKGANERKVNYYKGIRRIERFGHLVKTNPIKPNFI